MIISKVKSSIGFGFSLLVLELFNLVFLYLKPVSYVTPHKLNIGVITMSKLNELESNFIQLKSYIKEFEDDLDAQLIQLKQCSVEFTEDLLGLAHLLYKSNTKYGDVWVEVKLSVLEWFVEAISERIMFITASYAKTKMAGFLPCFETLLSISSIVGKNISNLKEKLKL